LNLFGALCKKPLIGFLVKGVSANLDRQLKLLNLSRATPIHWVNAHNQNSRAALNHLAIDIVCRLDRKKGPIVLSSEAFRYAMAVAAIAQIWWKPKYQEPKTVNPAKHNRQAFGVPAVQEPLFS
jgi:hypothetical protein